jgi:hypothetical protein
MIYLNIYLKFYFHRCVLRDERIKLYLAYIFF